MIKIYPILRFSLLFLVSLLAVVQPDLYAGRAPFPMQFSPEELKALEQELNQVINSLTPEQREQFNRMQQNIAKIPESELIRLLQGELTPEEERALMRKIETGEGLEEAVPVELPSIEEEKEEEIEVEAPPIGEKAEHTITLINKIIEKAESFLVKVQIMPDIAAKINRWQKKKLISSPKSIDWATFQYEIEKFVLHLRAFIAQNPENRTYFYLNDLTADSSLLSSLQTIANVLNKFEKDIEVPAFGLEKPSQKTRDSIQKLLSSFAFLLLEENINSELDKVIAKFEPEAKKLRDQIAALEKKAQEQAARQRHIQPSIATGQPARLPPVGRGMETDHEWPHGGYRPYYEPSDWQRYAPSSERPSTTGKKPAGKEKAEGKKEPKKKEEKKKEKKPLTEDEKKIAKECAKLVNSFEQKVQTAAQAFVSSDLLKNASKTIKAPALDQQFQPAASIIMSHLGKRKGIIDTLSTLHVKMSSLPDDEQEAIKKDIETIWQKESKPFNKFVKNTRLLKRSQRWWWKTLSAAKRYLYFAADTAREPEAAPVEPSQPSPEVMQKAHPYLDNLRSLEQLINNAESTIDEINAARDRLLQNTPAAPEEEKAEEAEEASEKEEEPPAPSPTIADEGQEVQEVVFNALVHALEGWYEKSEQVTEPSELFIELLEKVAAAYLVNADERRELFNKIEAEELDIFDEMVSRFNERKKVLEQKAALEPTAGIEEEEGAKEVTLVEPVEKETSKAAQKTQEEKEIAELRTKVKYPVSLYDLARLIQEAEATVATFTKQKKSTAPETKGSKGKKEERSQEKDEEEADED